jgi:predicted MPP superfamily phosphohydrolase
VAWRLAPVSTVAVDEYIVTPRYAGLPNDLRIVFASDFHAGPATAAPLLERAVEQIGTLQPDVLLLGGDFVSIDPAHGACLFERLARLHGPLGRYAVLGNHDHWSGAPAVVAQLQDAGVELLTNRSVRLPPPFEAVTISGLDDYTSGEPDGAAAFAGAGDIRVVLMHQPSGLEQIGDRPFDVALCGHTHGGQIAWRGGVPLMVASGPLSRQYNAGRYVLPGERTLIVSRGVGCGTLPIRINAPSSVVLCTLRAG